MFAVSRAAENPTWGLRVGAATFRVLSARDALTVIDANAVTPTQSKIGLLAEFDARTTVEHHAHQGVLTSALIIALDFVAQQGTAYGTGDRRYRVAHAATDLVPDHAARNAANDGTSARGRCATLKVLHIIDVARLHSPHNLCAFIATFRRIVGGTAGQCQCASRA